MEDLTTRARSPDRRFPIVMAGPGGPEPSVPVLLCIDIEPDPRETSVQGKEDWRGFEVTHRFFSELRPRLERVTKSPVHFSWFLRMDPQVETTYGSACWPVEHYRGLLDTLQAEGDELGIHTHAWRWEERAGHWIADHGNQPWVEHCVRSSLDAFARSLGRKPKSFRFGDRWMNEPTLRLLDRLGFRCDLSVEPGYPAMPALNQQEHHTGALPDYTRVPRHPYRPSRRDYQRPGRLWRRGIWVVPISTGFPKGDVLPETPAHDQENVTLNLACHAPSFCRVMDGLLERLPEPHLVLVARSNVSIVPEQRECLDAIVAHVLAHPQAHQFRFETPTELVRRLEG
jgi:hypothetical protein